MEMNIYIVRHCEAEGQPSESPLTEKGFQQTIQISEFFSDIKIDQIISSPFLRAIQSVELLSNNRNLKIDIDERLSERRLSKRILPEWSKKIKATFDDFELKFEGGESSNEASKRVSDVLDEVLQSKNKNTVISTHGNLTTLLLNRYNGNFGFDCWKNLSNPDVFLLSYTKNNMKIKHLWQD